MEDKAKNKLKIHVDEAVRHGIYTNAFAVHFRPHEVTLDFGFVQIGTDEIDIGSRIVMTHEIAEQFLSNFQNAILDYRNKTKKK